MPPLVRYLTLFGASVLVYSADPESDFWVCFFHLTWHNYSLVSSWKNTQTFSSELSLTGTILFRVWILCLCDLTVVFKVTNWTFWIGVPSEVAIILHAAGIFWGAASVWRNGSDRTDKLTATMNVAKTKLVSDLKLSSLCEHCFYKPLHLCQFPSIFLTAFLSRAAGTWRLSPAVTVRNTCMPWVLVTHTYWHIRVAR